MSRSRAAQYRATNKGDITPIANNEWCSVTVATPSMTDTPMACFSMSDARLSDSAVAFLCSIRNTNRSHPPDTQVHLLIFLISGNPLQFGLLEFGNAPLLLVVIHAQDFFSELVNLIEFVDDRVAHWIPRVPRIDPERLPLECQSESRELNLLQLIPGQLCPSFRGISSIFA